MAGWGAAASSAIDLFGGFLERSAAPSKGWQRQLQLEQRDVNKDIRQESYDRFLENRTQVQARDDAQIQRTVTDAKAAGLHPLFALGGRASNTGTGSPPSFAGSSGGFIPGQSSSGSALGGGLRAAARSIRKYVPTALEQSQTNVNNARALEINSAMKRAEQDALNVRNIPGDLGTAQAWPIGSGPPPPKLSNKYWIRSPLGNVLADPRYPDAEAMERRYGEVADWVHGLPLYMRERFTQNPDSWFNWKPAAPWFKWKPAKPTNYKWGR